LQALHDYRLQAVGCATPQAGADIASLDGSVADTFVPIRFNDVNHPFDIERAMGA
jgi:hypothetical protein